MIEGKWFAQGSDLAVPLGIRQSVFGRAQDALDDLAQQVVVYRAGIPVGTARLWWRDGSFWAGDIAVLPEERRNGYGDLLVRLLTYKAVTHHARQLSLTCPASLATFFARYGFQPLQQGDPMTMLLDTATLSGGCAGCGNRTCQG